MSTAERTLVVNALKFFHGQRYPLAAYVVMDDHVHVVVLPLGDNTLGQILHSWKSFTAKEINKLRGATGTVWQKDSYTRVLVSRKEVEARLNYILKNPAERWTGIEGYEWVENLHNIL